MISALALHRFLFAFTITFHYLFPQLTMGLALLIVVLQTIGQWRHDGRYLTAARFWGQVFAINFVLGVVTGIPMEFQFGTDWAEFSRLTGGVIGQPLVMEAVFSFFLESAFLGLFLYGRERLGPRLHWLSAVALFAGSWLSGFFIVSANGWMQHPVAYARPNDAFEVTSFTGVLLNPWSLLQYAHTMSGAVVTGAFTMAALGAFYLLNNREEDFGRLFVRVGVVVGVIAAVFQVFPTGDLHARYLSRHQPATTAAMEGLFNTEKGAPMILIGQPDPEHATIENPIALNAMLSFVIYGTFRAEVKGLDAFPRENWPDNIPLLFFAYHIMAGLGTIFVVVMAVSAFLLWRGQLYSSRLALWLLLLAAPFPFIANTAGWLTTELGRQPWVVYGLLRTGEGASKVVSSGSTWFVLLGYLGMYTLLALSFVFLVQRLMAEGPSSGRVETPAHGA
jgi:cytochrome bd ubiquinol oxidase subunit I